MFLGAFFPFSWIYIEIYNSLSVQKWHLKRLNNLFIQVGRALAPHAGPLRVIISPAVSHRKAWMQWAGALNTSYGVLCRLGSGSQFFAQSLKPCIVFFKGGSLCAAVWRRSHDELHDRGVFKVCYCLCEWCSHGWEHEGEDGTVFDL